MHTNYIHAWYHFRYILALSGMQVKEPQCLYLTLYTLPSLTCILLHSYHFYPIVPFFCSPHPKMFLTHTVNVAKWL